MSAPSDIKLSKFLSLVLRHKPDEIGLVLDANGWADVAELLRLAALKGFRVPREQFDRVVRDSDKQRFAVSPDGLRVRANQGHSVNVELDLPPAEPPEFLFHGTATRFLDSIRADGLRPGSRQHVHLSFDPDTAAKVGARHGTPVVLRVHAGRMHAAGFVFTVSVNGVWLTDRVPPEYIEEGARGEG